MEAKIILPGIIISGADLIMISAAIRGCPVGAKISFVRGMSGAASAAFLIFLCMIIDV